jgi:hypothetical protein
MSTPAGRYGDQTSIENVFGQDNVRRWSNLNNVDAGADLARVQLACNQADAELEGLMWDGPFTVPLVFEQPGARLIITDHWATLAGFWLYKSRGEKDAPADPEQTDGNRYRKQYNEARSALRKIRAGVTPMPLGRAYVSPTGPTAVADVDAQTSRADGSPR